MTSRRSHLATAAARTTIVVALVVLGLGLTRFLVVCSMPCCQGKVAFVHMVCAGNVSPAPALRTAASEPGGTSHCACCRHRAAPPRRDGDDVATGAGCCEEHAVDVGLGPLPSRVVIEPHAPACRWFGLASPPAARRLSTHLVVRPPTTGPPRPDPRTERIATTTLLL